jgi:hypothetical protein
MTAATTAIKVLAALVGTGPASPTPSRTLTAEIAGRIYRPGIRKILALNREIYRGRAITKNTSAINIIKPSLT